MSKSSIAIGAWLLLRAFVGAGQEKPSSSTFTDPSPHKSGFAVINGDFTTWTGAAEASRSCSSMASAIRRTSSTTWPRSSSTLFEFWPPQVAKFRAGVPHAQVIEMPNTRHDCFIHRQEEVVREMRAFLAGRQ